MTEKQAPTMMMTPNQLRALADALERLSLGTGKIGKAADYLRACADARLAASAIQTRLGERPIISGWDESTFKLNEEVALYTHPAPAAPQAKPKREPQACMVEVHSSRACERGTRGCVVTHEPKREPLSDSDADYWLRHRQAILDAIRREGFVLMSNACGFWLKRMDRVSEAHGIGGSDEHQ